MKLFIIDLYGDGESLRVCEDKAGIDQILAEFVRAEDSDEPFDEFMERKGVQLFLMHKPLTREEQRFVGEIILHFSVVYQTMRTKMFVKLDGLERDIREFFGLPIPKAVWELVKPFHNRDFVKFVERCLA